MRFGRTKKHFELDWKRIVSREKQQSLASRSMSRIVAAMTLEQRDAERSSYLISSACDAEGKTTVSLHLAARLAASGKRTLLVDAHWRRPTIGRLLGVSDRRGLADLLSVGSGYHELLVTQQDLPGLRILPAGVDHPPLFDRDVVERLKELFSRARQEFEFVLVDGGPTSSGPEALAVARAVDGVLLVVVCDRTQQAEAVAAQDDIGRFGGELVGVVLNRVPNYLPRYYRSL